MRLGRLRGRVLPAALPSWYPSSLNVWTQIPNTNGRVQTVVVNGVSEPALTSGDSWFDAWGAIVVRPDTSEIFTGAAGGHGDGSDNRMVSIGLESNTPTWAIRAQPSPGARPTNQTSGYYPDGLPVARHHYGNLFYLPSITRVMFIGGRAIHGDGGPETPAITGFNVATNTWDPAGTFQNVNDTRGGTRFGIVCNQRTGTFFSNILTSSGISSSDRWVAPSVVSGTNLGTYTQDAVTGFTAVNNRWPAAWDSVRQECFLLNIGNGEGGTPELGLRALRWADTGGAADTITFNSSSAYTAWLAAVPTYAGMDYDPDNGRYLFIHGGWNGSTGAYNAAENGKVYVITPNATNTWDMSVLSTTGSPTDVPNAGVNGRFKYVPRLKGFVYLPRANSNLWFLRTA